jgi:hypothetical protein
MGGMTFRYIGFILKGLVGLLDPLRWTTKYNLPRVTSQKNEGLYFNLI